MLDFLLYFYNYNTPLSLLLGPTFLGSPTVRIVGIGVNFSLLLQKFCWTYRFKNCWPVNTVVNTFDSFGRATDLPFVGPTVSGSQACWGTFSLFIKF